jgi:GT2 family glycosyltransferase
VLLTFQAPDRIRRSIPALLAQRRGVDAAIVVDNHSSDETPALLDQLLAGAEHVRVVRTDENLGPAGGFATGMQLGLETGCDYLWLLDDDSEPEPDCLANLLTVAEHGAGDIYWPRNIDETGGETGYPAWRGELLTADIVRRGGVPLAELFWGQEDTEYLQWRLPHEHGAVSVRVPEAVVRHEIGNPRKATSWHFYYLTRNTVWYRLHRQRPRQVRRLLRSMVRLWGRALLREAHPVRNLAYAARGLVDGLRGKLGKTVDPASMRP